MWGVDLFLNLLNCFILYRSVAEEQRSLALGVQSVIWRMLGGIPGPILYGVIFDSSCIYWQEDCGRRGNCWVYNNDSIGNRAFFLSFFGVAISAVFMILCWLFFPPISCTKPGQKSAKEVELQPGIPNKMTSDNVIATSSVLAEASMY